MADKKSQTPNAKVFNIVLPQDLVDKVDKIAEQEFRNRSETIREALRNYVNQNSAGRKLHGLSAQSRESGDPIKALELNVDAMIAYSDDKDRLGFAEVQADRAISLDHLARKTSDPFFHQGYLILAKNAAQSAVELAEESGDSKALAIPYLRFGKALEDLNKIPEAVEAYQKAFQNMTQNPPENHNRAAVLADVKVHLYSAMYENGQKEALKDLEEAIRSFDEVEVLSDTQFEAQGKQLKYNQEPSYNYNVWVSGAHLKMASILKDDDPQKAEEHLHKAEEIINLDNRLTLRHEQLEKITSSFDH